MCDKEQELIELKDRLKILVINWAELEGLEEAIEDVRRIIFPPDGKGIKGGEWTK